MIKKAILGSLIVCILFFKIFYMSGGSVFAIDRDTITLKPENGKDLENLEKALIQVKNGDKINFNDGEFNFYNSTVKIPKSITLTGSGKIKSCKIDLINISNVEIDNLELIRSCINIQKSSNIKIINCGFNNFKEDINGVINIKNDCSNLTINKNNFENIGYLTNSSVYGCAIKSEIYSSKIKNIYIKDNKFNNINGPAAIWIGGSNAKFINIFIDDNLIENTENFGVEFYKISGKLSFMNVKVRNNIIQNIGEIRESKTGNGCGGIYNNLSESGIEVINNTINNVLEVGIEGGYNVVKGNYIKDTGSDALNHPIADNSGIYFGGKIIENNTIVNPGNSGGIHFFSEGNLSNCVYKSNSIRNEGDFWKPNIEYQIGDEVINNNSWYKCIKGGKSGSTFSDLKSGDIIDGECIWDYKKELCLYGFNLNIVKGISNIEINSNNVNNINTFLSSSKFVSNIKIINNKFTNSKGESTFIGGYGEKKCRKLVVKNNEIKVE